METTILIGSLLVKDQASRLALIIDKISDRHVDTDSLGIPLLSCVVLHL